MDERKYATDVVYRVMYENGFASLLMRKSKLENMAFVTDLVYGTIRQYRYLKYQWEAETKHVRHKTEVLLNLATYELLIRKTPAYAVINEYVNLAVKNEKGFVNALLRKISTRDLKPCSDVCIRYSHPEWLYQLWKAHYGSEIAEKIMQADQSIPSVYGRINPLKITMEELQKDASIQPLNQFCFTSTTSILDSPLFQEGKVLIQNPSSILPVLALDLEDHLNVLDVCSAPGTKTQLIGALMHNTGQVTACDLYPHRVKLIEELMTKTGVTNVHAQVADGTKDCFEQSYFDRILCDVPCSGLGDLMHKPEIRYHLKPENLDEIIRIQHDILAQSARYLKADGILVYSTCTLNKKENEKQVERFLKENPAFERLDEKTVFPYENHYDGFYIAKLKKSKG